MYSKFVTSFMLLSLALSVFTSSVPDPCAIKRKCSTAEETVYCVDDQQCYLFRNQCIFENDLCQRRAKNEPDLEVVTKEKCSEKCRNYCTEEYFPVCAEFNNTLQTFGNKCDFHRISCQEDKSYMFVHYGACEKA